MKGRIFRAILTVSAAVLLLGTLLMLAALSPRFDGQGRRQLILALDLAAAGVERDGQAYLQALPPGGSRLTWVAADGAVLYDTAVPAGEMDNHAQRQEIQAALAAGRGSSVRYSRTMLEKTLYQARRLSDGTVLRICASQDTAGALALGLLPPLGAMLALSLVMALFLAERVSRRIVQPLGALDLDHPLDNDTYDELSPLLKRISRQRQQIDAQRQSLAQEKAAFVQIAAQMQEGLVLLDDKGTVQAINPAGRRLFRAGDDAPGRDFLTLERSRAVSAAVAQAMERGHSQLCLRRDGREYQLSLSAISSGGGGAGVVLLAFDVTEQARAGALRREFTANVSHELKTPLTAILGSAELMDGGLVAAADMPRFAGHIHAEASRLLRLIEDILRLSQLDEGAALPCEAADLSVLAEQAAGELASLAAERGISVSLETEPCPITTVPRLVQEIAGNLLENAIKYNVEGGTVHLTVKQTAQEAVLTVADSGIGIAPEEQRRVFERFYRVDKSHSRLIGGTGLGLSIVKHAAAYLGARLDLQSTPGAGTRVTVVFPREQAEDAGGASHRAI